MSKQYGLIIPKSTKQVPAKPITRPSIFEEESDSDSEVSKKPTGLKQALKKQDRVLQEKAVAEDPTIFQYDEVYDDIDQKRKESKLARQDIDRKPKYISKLLQAAERRKCENERRIERVVQRERDAEGEEFKDKESFVTSAYRKKLEEMKELEEKEKREEYLESIGDVRKQGNLDGFYRHLFDQKVNYAANSNDNVDTLKNQATIEDASQQTTETSNKSNCQNDQKSDLNLTIPTKRPTEATTKEQTKKKRKYRHRKQSDVVSSEDEHVESAAVESAKHIQSNLDADSDFSIDTSSDSDEHEPTNIQNESAAEDIKVAVKTSADDNAIADNTSKDALVKEKEEGNVDEVEKVLLKPKIDIWKKRTVGVAFEEALQRYFERKALRESNEL